MAAAVSVAYEKRGTNFKTTVFSLAMSGNYPGDPGEVVTLTDLASNPAARTVTGPGGAAVLGGANIAIQQLGGYTAQFKPTATAGQYNLSFWTSGGTELGAGAYPAAISGGALTVEVDHSLQGY